ncbi:hypothetical protein SAMD00019534_002720 [Acytostelium subglobosum LB1]|uniref:hypothetical protein n=1 Tax=Acytostelium subglobosum LB1 TaxID=1410327 RepID=UPI000644E1CA|nr:hypothetical protein SAMD00019534_002720 [Acytostelium subglobosum LB1]GAM17097.1 hypothetical protein SAMD00019534_002720 [Acytostelium subglobosum LB1]|eukprot:XP_012759159.1 hypothetical protein SAMD00019534_002720 [Acytostelium subglobosum LB1]
MNPHQLRGYPESHPYDYNVHSSPSTPNMYSPVFRPMYPAYHYPGRFTVEPAPAAAADEEHVDRMVMYEQAQRYLGRIQYLEEEINRKKETIDGLQFQLSKYEQERQDKKKQSRYWTPEEHHRFLEALSKFGHRDVKSIAAFVGSRNSTQVRTHAQKYFLRIDRERQRKLENKDSAFDRDDKNDTDWLLDYDEDGGSPNLSPTMMGSNPFGNNISIGAGVGGGGGGVGAGGGGGGISSPNIKRKREPVFITAAQAKNALLYKEQVLASLPPTFTAVDYDHFSRGLISFIDQEDTHTLFKLLKENFIQSHSIEMIEMVYKAFQGAVNKKKDGPSHQSPLCSPRGNNNSGNNNNNTNNSNNSSTSTSTSTSNSNSNTSSSTTQQQQQQQQQQSNFHAQVNGVTSTNSNYNTPEPTSPTHLSRSPSFGKKTPRGPPPLSIKHELLPQQCSSPSSMYSPNLPAYMTAGSPQMMMGSPFGNLWPPRPPPYDYRRLDHNGSMVNPYFSMHHPSPLMISENAPQQVPPAPINSDDPSPQMHPGGGWMYPGQGGQQMEGHPSAQWSMSHQTSPYHHPGMQSSNMGGHPNNHPSNHPSNIGTSED